MLNIHLRVLQVKIGHMAAALSKTYKSPVVDTVQCLPQHQQVILLLVICTTCTCMQAVGLKSISILEK